MSQTLKSLQRPETFEAFVEFFRSRHGWKCHPGSQTVKDLTDFAKEQARSPQNAPQDTDELYIRFCVANGIAPKRARHDGLEEKRQDE